MVYFSVVKCPCPRDHPLIKCISVVFDSKDIGDLKAMTTNIFLRICTFVYLIRKMKFQNGIQREPRRGVIPSMSSARRSPQGNFLFFSDEEKAQATSVIKCEVNREFFINFTNPRVRLLWIKGEIAPKVSLLFL